MTGVMVHAANPIVRAGLESIIRSESALEVVGSSSNLETMIQLLAQRQPDVVLLEWLETEEESLWEQLLTQDPNSSNPAIVALTDDAQTSWVIDTLSQGVQALLPRTATAEEILAGVSAAAAGLVVLHPDIAESLLSINLSPVRPLTTEPLQALTSREIEVLEMLALGLGNKAIAHRLTISEHTVKFHISSIFTKLNASSRTEAVTLGIRQGLIML